MKAISPMNTPSPALEARITRAKALLEAHPPGQHAAEGLWGFYSYSDAHQAMGGGVGAFVWAPDLESIHAFIANVLPCDPPAHAEEEDALLCDSLDAILARHRPGEVRDDETLGELNEALATRSVIEWIGPFADLATGQGAFGRRMRHQFRRSLDETRAMDIPEPSVPNTVPALTADEHPAFVSWLADYGL